MLILRDAQLQSLNRAGQARFRKTVADYLESDYSAQCQVLGPEGVTNLIEQGIRKADRYGIEFESDICDLIGAMAEFGGNLDEQEWVAEILRDTKEPGNVKIGRLNGWLEALRAIGWKG